MKNLIKIIFLTVCYTACSQNKIYFDTDWKETSKENASYYRDEPQKENGIWFVEDYYISGEKQFVGHTKDSLATIFEGDVTWYFKTGKVENKIRYKNGKQIGFYTVLEGTNGSPNEGWDEKDLFFIDTSNAAPAENARSVSTSVYEHHYTNTSIIASQHTSIVGDDNTFSFTLYFNKKGDTIGRLDYNSSSDKWMGKEIVFYEEEKRGKNDINSIKAINTYNKGAITHTEHYNADEKLIAEGTLKDNKSFNGTFFNESCRFKKIEQYKNGHLQKQTTYNKEDEKIGEVSFKNDVPHTGVFYNCTSLQTYKNGKLHGKSIQYLHEESESIDFEFTYKMGVRHGDYYIYQDESLLLEKGSYKNDVQIGEVLYYHHGVHSEKKFNNYYLKATIKLNKNKLFVSELSQFNLDDNKLIKTFKLEKAPADKFTYINNGYHAIHLNDFNSDGFDDLQITYNHHIHDVTTNTYYIFNSETGKYEHLVELDNAFDIEVYTSNKNIEATFVKKFEDKTTHITYDFSNDNLIKKLEIEETYHSELDTTLVTQTFPVPLNKYPLLATSLPPLTFVQQGKEQQISNLYQTIALKKEPFSITLPGLINTGPPFGFNVKITASYNKNIFKKALVNQKEEYTSIFGSGTTFAMGSNQPFLIIDDDGHHVFYYDNTVDDTLDKIKNINETVLLLQCNINKMHDGTKEKNISEISKPIYMVVYMDKNENLKIDENEIYYLTVEFKS